VDKYTFDSKDGLFVKRALVNKDSAILEAHYKGKVPTNIEADCVQVPGRPAATQEKAYVIPRTVPTVGQMKQVINEECVKFPTVLYNCVVGA
jgi:hypothetical protein